MSDSGFHPENTALPVGPLRSKTFVDDVDTNDYELTGGECFLVQVTGAGDIQYEDGAGDTNTETGLAAGDSIQVAGIPVLVRKILAASTTVSGVAIGRG